MAQEERTDNPLNHPGDEETPLLRDSRSDQQPEDDVADPKKPRQSKYIWRAFWVILTVLILTVFIKGWVDAGGDVDVGVAFDPETILVH